MYSFEMKLVDTLYLLFLFKYNIYKIINGLSKALNISNRR